MCDSIAMAPWRESPQRQFSHGLLDFCTSSRKSRYMWSLKTRGEKIRDWTDLGEVPDLTAAARTILKHENDSGGAVYFRLYVDPVTNMTGETDAEILSRIEYQGNNSFYLLTRQQH